MHLLQGAYHQKAVWTKGGEKLTFHAHADEGGVGSSLFEGHAYGKCGAKECGNEDFSETYQVETVDFVEYLKMVARPQGARSAPTNCCIRALRVCGLYQCLESSVLVP